MKDEKGVSFQLNAVPIEWVSGGSEVYFPRPFLILGIYKQAPETIGFGPSWPTIFFNYETPANQNVYSGLSYNMMIEVALANMREESSAPVTFKYLRPGTQNIDFRGYFSKYLNDDTIVETEQNLNTFLEPGKLFMQFCFNNSASTALVWENNYRDFLYQLQRTTDKRLWGAPGVYSIGGNPESPLPWAIENGYETYDEG
jgi:hypothetical protein